MSLAGYRIYFCRARARSICCLTPDARARIHADDTAGIHELIVVIRYDRISFLPSACMITSDSCFFLFPEIPFVQLFFTLKFLSYVRAYDVFSEAGRITRKSAMRCQNSMLFVE